MFGCGISCYTAHRHTCFPCKSTWGMVALSWWSANRDTAPYCTMHACKQNACLLYRNEPWNQPDSLRNVTQEKLFVRDMTSRLCGTLCVIEGRVLSCYAPSISRLCRANLSCRHRGAGFSSLGDRTFRTVGLHAHRWQHATRINCKRLPPKNSQKIIRSSYTQCHAGHSSSEQELYSPAVTSGHLDEVAVAKRAVKLASRLCQVSFTRNCCQASTMFSSTLNVRLALADAFVPVISPAESPASAARTQAAAFKYRKAHVNNRSW